MILMFYFGSFFLILVTIFVVLIFVVYYKIPKLIKCDFKKKHILITGNFKYLKNVITIC